MKSSLNVITQAFILILTSLLTVSCNSNSDDGNIVPSETDISVSNVRLYDVGNNGNGSDFKVTFTKSSNEALIEEYKVLFVTASNTTFNLEIAESVAEGNYISHSIDDGEVVYFGENSKSVNGELISSNIAYVVYILSVSSKEEINNSLSESSNSVQLSNLVLVETLTWAEKSNTEGVSIDSEGAVYITDIGLTGVPGNFNGKDVFKATVDKSFSVFNSSLSAPLGHAFDENDNLYVANYNKAELTKINAAGEASVYISDARLTGGDVTFDKAGNMYVSVIKSSSVYKIGPIRK